MGYFLLSTTLASAIGPFIGLFVYRQSGFETLLLVSLGMSVLAFLLAAGIRVPREETEPAASTAGSGLQSYFEFKALPIALISFVIYFCYSSLLSFFSAYAAELDMLEAGQYFFLVYSLAIIISLLRSERLQIIGVSTRLCIRHFCCSRWDWGCSALCVRFR